MVDHRDAGPAAGTGSTSERAAGSNTHPRPGLARFPYGGRHSPVPESLRGLYERYCEGQARSLLALLPREHLRGFYRQAMLARGDDGEVVDPLALARGFARELLPLPPYEEWVPDYLSNRGAYLEELSIPGAPRTEEPVAVAVRSFGDGWYASLCLRAVEEGWTGFIRFHQTEGVRSFRTADVFRGDDVELIRARFSSFDEGTLQAFLRSTQP
jgi:hypothetical protein